MLALFKNGSFARLIPETGWVDLTGNDRVSPPLVGWDGASGEDTYAILAYQPFAAPEGKQRIGEPSYDISSGVCVETYSVEDVPAYVPQSISDRQFAHVLALQGLISQEEALAWVKTGDIPSALQSLIDDIPDPVIKFSAQMLLAGATVFERDHPMTAQLAAGLGMSSAQVDDLWRAAAAL